MNHPHREAFSLHIGIAHLLRTWQLTSRTMKRAANLYSTSASIPLLLRTRNTTSDHRPNSNPTYWTRSTKLSDTTHKLCPCICFSHQLKGSLMAMGLAACRGPSPYSEKQQACKCHSCHLPSGGSISGTTRGATTSQPTWSHDPRL